MAHTPGKRTELRAAYAHKCLPLEQAAALIGVSIGTARRWKREALASGDDWDTLRAASHLAGEGMESVARQMLMDYVVQHKALMERINCTDMEPGEKVELLSSLADSFAKTVAASKRVLPETNTLATALKVLCLLAEFTREHYPQHAPAIVELIEPFGEELAKVDLK